MKITTPEQFEAEMQKLYERDGWDAEVAHKKMDEVMCRVLLEHGYRNGIAMFDKQERWYA